MRAALVPSAALSLAFAGLAACGPSADPVSADAAAAAAAPVDSSLALFSNGGGCYPPAITASGTDLLVLVNPEWAPIVNGSSPLSEPVLLHGTVIDSFVSRDDFPATHVRYDQNTFVQLDPADAGLLATGNVFGPENKPVPHLELEWETGSYPAWAWAGEGDRVVALGRWIFDCGHPDPVPGACRGTTNLCVIDDDCGAGGHCDGVVWNYRSEMHPPQAVAVIRGGRGAVLAPEAEAIPATRADVLVSGDGGAAGDACVVTHKGTLDEVIGAPCFPLSAPLALLPPGAPPLNSTDFAFDLPLPAAPGGIGPVWRVLARPTPTLGGSPVPARLSVLPALAASPPHLRVTVHMTEPVGGQLPTGFAATILAGWRRSALPEFEHVRVTVDGIVVNDARKPALPVPELPVPPGWLMQASVNGEWQELSGLDEVAAGVEGQFFPTPAVFEQFLPRDGTLRIFAGGASATCVNTLFGQSLLQSILAFGGDQLLAEACLFTTDPGLGAVALSFAGPDFGARSAPYEMPSQGGSCSLTGTIDCASNADCPSGESCQGIGDFSLRFRIETVEE